MTNLRELHGATRKLLAFSTIDTYRRFLSTSIAGFSDRELAEDATGATFLRAFESISTYRGGSFRAWLFAFARTVTADHRRASSVLPIAHDSNVSCIPDLTDRGFDADAAKSEIEELLTLFTPDQREVVELRLAGLTGEEIAIAKDRSVASVKMLQYRAIRHMKKRTQLKCERRSPLQTWGMCETGGDRFGR